ncbi:MAG TPA: hypothetical protein VKK79_13555, partial [Candidatus Lokiarchaeia archaeon]|nr:hypothetical protein [Candidatus Lokiarchaeia archaeon]
MDINTNDYIPLEVIEQFLEFLPFEVPRAIELLEYRVKPPRQHTKTTHTYNTRLKRLIFYLYPIFNRAVLDWQNEHLGSLRRVLWRAIFRELVFQLSNYAKCTEFILDREFPALWNEIEHIQTSIPHLGLLETLRHKFLTNLLNESKFTPSHTNVRVYDELRRNVLPLPFEVPIAEIARKLAMEADIELWLTQVEGMIFYQNRYKKMRRLVWTLLNKDPGLLADAFLY